MGLERSKDWNSSLNSEDSMKKEGKRLDFCLNSEDSMNKEGKRLDFYSNSENLSNGYHENFNKNENLLIDEALKAATNHKVYIVDVHQVALMDCDGIVYRGSYAEFMLQPEWHCVLVGGGGGYERIVAAVLVEKEGALVVQEDTAKIILKKVAPKCDLKVVYCFHEKWASIELIIMEAWLKSRSEYSMLQTPGLSSSKPLSIILAIMKAKKD
ncbi:hypothetical protein Leryth_022740 [Lithospermum erythrorhizon]|nr:hypothetical protein Leryth_022740 [Lithospermum erythrorhizon]